MKPYFLLSSLLLLSFSVFAGNPPPKIEGVFKQTRNNRSVHYLQFIPDAEIGFELVDLTEYIGDGTFVGRSKLVFGENRENAQFRDNKIFYKGHTYYIEKGNLIIEYQDAPNSDVMFMSGSAQTIKLYYIPIIEQPDKAAFNRLLLTAERDRQLRVATEIGSAD